MRRWRLAALLLLTLLAGAPFAVLAAEVIQAPPSAFGEELGRQAAVAANTLLLVAGTLALALPLGMAGAVLFYRTDLPGRGVVRFFIFLTLFIPLPVLATAWQSALGAGGFLAALWSDAPGRPWASGLMPAIWIHAAAALPWVVLIVGHALRWVERELEEDALLCASPWRVLGSVTLPRCRGAIGAAALFVALQTASEITVADLMQVRTFAEEVYLEFWAGGADRVGRAALAALPGMAAAALLVLIVLPRLDRSLPPLGRVTPQPLLFRLGRWRVPCLALVLLAALVLAGVPLLSLIWKAGLQGAPQHWSPARAAQSVAAAASSEGATLLTSAAFALLASGLAVAAALVLCWLALESRWFRAAVLVVGVLLWAMPAPLLGVGLKGTILTLVGWFPQGPIATALHDGPSPLPVLWANLLRLLPCALAMLWPLLRMLPRELRESARIDGASPRQELALVVWPLSRRAAVWAALVLTALALGEVSAVAARVETPGWETYAHVLFDRMHYGTQNDVAGMCLLVVLAVAGAGLLAACGLAVRRR